MECTYCYKSRLGECELVFFEQENRISLLRTGKNELHLNLQLGNTFEMKYQAEGYQDIFFGGKLCPAKREEGSFEFSYDIWKKWRENQSNRNPNEKEEMTMKKWLVLACIGLFAACTP